MKICLFCNGSVLVWISSVKCSVQNTYNYLSVRSLWIRISVAAHLRGMRPTLTAGKANQCLEETQTLTELSI